MYTTRAGWGGVPRGILGVQLRRVKRLGPLVLNGLRIYSL